MQTRVRLDIPTWSATPPEPSGTRPTGFELRCPPLALIPEPGSEFWARAHAADVLRAWQLEHLAGVVDPPVAEMVLNGVRHASTHIAIVLHRVGSYFVIGVWDEGLRPSPSPSLTPAGRARDVLPVTRALADKFETVAAEHGGRLVRAWTAVDTEPDVLTIEQRSRALSMHSASLLTPDEQPTDDVIARVIEGLRALQISPPAAKVPAEDGPRRFSREGQSS